MRLQAIAGIPVRRVRRCLGASAVSLLLSLGFAAPGSTMELATDSDVAVRWDNTVKYSASRRLQAADSVLTSNPNPNFDDGDRNFRKGLISSRFDLLSEFDLAYKKDIGLRLSGAAWYDSVYNRNNGNDFPFTANPVSVAPNQFTDAAKRLHGDKAELLDAFVYVQGEISGTPASARLGRHTLLYGESLFLGANGIAGGQAPVDAVKALSVPSAQFKEILRPVGQLSGQLQLSNQVTLGAYYQYRWQSTRLPASGSYFSNTDFVGGGAERLIYGAPAAPGSPPQAFFRSGDLEARDSGQFGGQVRWRPEGRDTEFGFYATQYHDKTPQVYARPQLPPNVPLILSAGRIGSYQLVYPEDIKSYGASFSTVLGDANVAGEMSVRRNTPLVSQVVAVMPGVVADNKDNPAYAVGNSAHFNLSAIVNLSPGALWAGGSILAEAAWNRRTSIARNPLALDPGTTRDAWGMRMVFEPAYYQVLPGLDITVPVGLGYNPDGRSSVVAGFNGGVVRGGDLSVGINGEYLKAWKFGLNYTHYLGSANVYALPDANGLQARTYAQTLKDRDFVSFNVQRTF